MSETIEEILKLPIPHTIAYIIALASLVQLFIIFFVQRKDIMLSLKGEDGKWQFLELSGLVWLVIFPVVIIVDIFGIEVHDHTWSAMELVYFMNLSGKIGHRFLDKKFGPSKVTDDISIETTNDGNKTQIKSEETKN